MNACTDSQKDFESPIGDCSNASQEELVAWVECFLMNAGLLHRLRRSPVILLPSQFSYKPWLKCGRWPMPLGSLLVALGE